MSEQPSPRGEATTATKTIEIRKVATWRRLAAAAIVPVSCWYLSAALAMMGFTYGFYLGKPPAREAPHRSGLIDATIRHDAVWYLQIVDEGYRYDPAARSNVAFFPAYPLVAIALRRITGLGAEQALLVASNLSFLIAMIAFASYLRDRITGEDEDLIGYALAAAALFPTGCFFRLPYSESTFLAISVLAMLSMAHRYPFWVSALLVGLASGARPVGIGLLLPLSIHLWRSGGTLKRRVVRLSGAVPLGCWGLLAYMLYQFAAFDDPLASARTQRFWTFQPEVGLRERFVALAQLGPIASVYDSTSPTYWAAFDHHGLPVFSLQFANPAFMGIAVLLSAVGVYRRWLNIEELALCAALVVIPYLTRGFEMSMASSGRFVSVVFPIYIVLGHLFRLMPPPITALVLALLGFMFATYSGMFAAGYRIF